LKAFQRTNLSPTLLRVSAVRACVPECCACLTVQRALVRLQACKCVRVCACPCPSVFKRVHACVYLCVHAACMRTRFVRVLRERACTRACADVSARACVRAC